jgi:hypothetical protein
MRAVPIVLLFAFPGCESVETAADPGAMRADERREVNEAAAMLADDSVTLNALDRQGTDR